MNFVTVERRNGTVNLDGYSRRKTLKAALKDLAREVAKYDKGEADAITDYLDDTVEMVQQGMTNEAGCYYIEAQEVPCASRYKFLDGNEDNFDEDNVEMEYAEGNWYLYIRWIEKEVQ